MELTPPRHTGISPLAALPDYVSVAESGYHHIGRYSFLTSIFEPHDVQRYVVETIDDLAVAVRGAGWGPDGLVIDFVNQPDLSLFSLAFRGPRIR